MRSGRLLNLAAIIATVLFTAAGITGIAGAVPESGLSDFKTRNGSGSSCTATMGCYVDGIKKATDSCFTEADNADNAEDAVNDGDDMTEHAAAEMAPSMNAAGGLGNGQISLLAGGYCSWRSNSWSASYNGSNLIFSFNVEFYANGNSNVSYYPRYTFGYSESSNMPSNILDCTSTSNDASKVRSSCGTISFSEYVRNRGLSGERYLKMVGTITVDPDYVDNFTGGRFRSVGGGWGDDWMAYDASNITVSNFETASKQAQCGHASWSYTSNGAGGHKAVCSSCGYQKNESHSMSGGKCSKCGYVSNISLTIRYVMTGRTETETIQIAPGASYQPKSFTGYRKPAGITAPQSDKTIDIVMVPIVYTLTDGEYTYSIKYDESFQLPVKEPKGYEHTAYIVEGVS